MKKGYSTKSLKELSKLICKNCYKNIPKWNNDTYNCWLKYIKGCNRKDLIKNSHFLNPESLKVPFRKHPCYSEIAMFRKGWFRPTNKLDKINFCQYPWLLGLYYADGSISNGNKLTFALSLHESIIVNKVIKQLKEILGKEANVVKEKIENMYLIRTHGIEVCCNFPKKKSKLEFLKILDKFNNNQKLKFISGYVDGDGSCAFDVGIDSIQIYSKKVSYLPNYFYKFLKQFGYVSLIRKYIVYFSPQVGRILKPFILKRYVKRPYNGSVDIKKALNLLKTNSLRQTAKIMNFDKKTISLAVKQTMNFRSVNNVS